MSSSPSRSALPSAEASIPADALREVLPFFYSEVAVGTGTSRLSAGLAGEYENPSRSADAAALELRARALGREEGRADGRTEFAEQLGKERSRLAAALAQFAQDRGTYYQKVEAEVVQLALSIARQILHREAQVDPLLLAGIVRVALEKIEGATGVTLRLHPQNTADWRRHLASHMEPADLPEIVEDPAIQRDGCILETSMGVAELGLEVQMKEIERGMLDLLAARPGATSGVTP